MAEKKKLSNARKRVMNLIQQAADSLKIAKNSLKQFQDLPKETLAKAKSMAKVPNMAEQKRLTNERILTGLRKMGVATQGDVDALESKIRKIEASVVSKPKTTRTPKHAAK